MNKIKTLSLAVLGLVGFAAAGSAMAGTSCPASLSPAPWTATYNIGGTVASVAPGYASTSCKMNASLTANLGSAGAFVRDDTPAAEGRYRAQFLVNANNLTGLTTTQSVRIFAALTDAPALGVPELVKLTVFGNVSGTTKSLGILTACNSGIGGFCATSAPLTGAADNVYRIEIDWTKGATGGVKVWVNNNVEATTTASLTVNNTSWTGGVDSAALGLAQAAPGFRSSQLNKIVFFDQFDSRRQTFIGN